MTRRKFNISLVDNNILELTELFNLFINSSLLPDEVFYTDQHPTPVTITDNDSMCLCVL